MKRALMLILAAVAAALVAWRLTRYEGPVSVPWPEPGDGNPRP